MGWVIGLLVLIAALMVVLIGQLRAACYLIGSLIAGQERARSDRYATERGEGR